MQRIASVALVSILFVTVCGGCSLFGKKTAPAADAYDPTMDSSAQQYPSQTYQPIPADSTGAGSGAGSRYHTVQKKETLYSIARQYYGDQAKWKEIYAANRSDISDPNRIRVGQRLVIP